MKRIRDAQTILGTLDHGEVMAELSREITETIADLNEQTGGRPKAKTKGSVTLKLNIVVENGTATIEPQIESKRPKPALGSSFFWTLDDGSLTTEHPKQTDMFNGPRPATREETA